MVRKICNECEDNHYKEEKTNQKRVEVIVTSGGNKVDNCNDLCVPWEIEVFFDHQRVTNQQMEKELVLVARRDK